MSENLLKGILEFKNLLNLGIKFFGIFGSIFYFIFLLVVQRQVKTMRKVVEVVDDSWLLFLVSLQLILSVFLFLFALLV